MQSRGAKRSPASAIPKSQSWNRGKHPGPGAQTPSSPGPASAEARSRLVTSRSAPRSHRASLTGSPTPNRGSLSRGCFNRSVAAERFSARNKAVDPAGPGPNNRRGPMRIASFHFTAARLQVRKCPVLNPMRGANARRTTSQKICQICLAPARHATEPTPGNRIGDNLLDRATRAVTSRDPGRGVGRAGRTSPCQPSFTAITGLELPQQTTRTPPDSRGSRHSLQRPARPAGAGRAAPGSASPLHDLGGSPRPRPTSAGRTPTAQPSLPDWVARSGARSRRLSGASGSVNVCGSTLVRHCVGHGEGGRVPRRWLDAQGTVR